MISDNAQDKRDVAFGDRPLSSPYAMAEKHVNAFYDILRQATLFHFEQHPDDLRQKQALHALAMTTDEYLNQIWKLQHQSNAVFDKRQREQLHELVGQLDSHCITYLDYYKLSPQGLSAKDYLKRLNGLMAWFQPKPSTVHTQTGDIEKEGNLIKRIDRTLYNLTTEQVRELQDNLAGGKSYSAWAATLTPFEKKCLSNNYIGEKPAYRPPPSVYRRSPGLANFLMHTYSVQTLANVEYSRHSAVSGLLYPFDLKNDDEAVRLGKMNIEQLVQTAFKERAEAYISQWNIKSPATIELPLLIQTLVSPTPGGLGDNDQKMVRLKERIIREYLKEHPQPEIQINGITVKATLRSTNRALNQHRVYSLNWRYSDNKDASREFSTDVRNAISMMSNYSEPKPDKTAQKCLDNIEKLLGTVKKSFFKLFQTESGRFKKLQKEIQALKNTPWFQKLAPKQQADIDMLFSTWNAYIKVANRSNIFGSENLMLAALEDILADKLGGLGYGSCKSGKDRKGVQTILADTLVRYFSETHQMPTSYNDPRLIQLFVNEFMTNHRAIIAEMNGPGAEGLKSLKGILPEPFYKALKANPGLLDIHKANSSYNKPQTNAGTSAIIQAQEAKFKASDATVAAEHEKAQNATPQRKDILLSADKTEAVQEAQAPLEQTQDENKSELPRGPGAVNM